MISLSCTVMHAIFDRKRRYNVHQLISQIGEDNIRKHWVSFEVKGDMFGRGCWWNAKRCWRDGLYAPSTHHLLIQDDVRVCDHFAEDVIKVIEARPNEVISLFCLPRKGFAGLEHRWGEAEGVWGCGIVMPKKILKDFLDWESRNIRPDFPHDDSRLSLYLVKHKMTAKVPFPNLVDHLALPSTFGARQKSRHSPNFLEQGRPADYDWTATEPQMRSINSYSHFNEYLINR